MDRGQSGFLSSTLRLKLTVILEKSRMITTLFIEVKRTTAPAITPSMRIALADLKLTEFHLVHAGNTTFQLSREIQAVALQSLLGALKPLR